MYHTAALDTVITLYITFLVFIYLTTEVCVSGPLFSNILGEEMFFPSNFFL